MQWFKNFNGPFIIETIIPALDSVQSRKRVRLLSGSIIIYFQYLLLADKDQYINGFEIYGGYAPEDFNRFANYMRTKLYYNCHDMKGTIIRENAFPTHDKNNPLFVLFCNSNIVESFINTENYPVVYYRRYETDEQQGKVYFSLTSNEDSFF